MIVEIECGEILMAGLEDEGCGVCAWQLLPAYSVQLESS